MTTSYEKEVKLTGILYLHRITDIRMSGTTFRNLRMLTKLCGDDAASKVIFVTTMWDKTSQKEGQKDKERLQREKREQELKDRYWRPMLELGARTARFYQDKGNCTQEIIKKLVDASEGKATLFEQEVVEQNRAIVETKAAKVLYGQMQTLLSEHKASLAELQEAAKKTNNPKLLADLKKEEERIQSELDKTFADARKLKLSFLQRFQLFFARNARGVCMYLAQFVRLLMLLAFSPALD